MEGEIAETTSVSPTKSIEEEEEEEQQQEQEQDEAEVEECISPLPSLPESPSPLVNEDHICSCCEEKYKQPRVLSCLHVFCTECLQKKLKVEADEENHDENQNADKESSHNTGLITCSMCKQETVLGENGVAGLAQDYVLVNMMDISAIEDMQIICTSCKAKEKAVARCSDCANFLCPNCVTAHQYMRCFENHKVSCMYWH